MKPKFIGYLDGQGEGITDYNDAGLFTLQQASRFVLDHSDAFISPDASGKWLVVIIEGIEEV